MIIQTKIPKNIVYSKTFSIFSTYLNYKLKVLSKNVLAILILTNIIMCLAYCKYKTKYNKNNNNVYRIAILLLNLELKSIKIVVNRSFQ